MKPSARRKLRNILLFAAVAVVYYFQQSTTVDDAHHGAHAHHSGHANHSAPGPLAASAACEKSAQDLVESLFQNQRSDVMVEAEGRVQRLLSDDNNGSRHQRIIVELSSGHTVMIAHNIDLAPRVDDLREGDCLRFKGEYEWNQQGGVVHWTHHDPSRRHEGGWLEHNGKRYE